MFLGSLFVALEEAEAAAVAAGFVFAVAVAVAVAISVAAVSVAISVAITVAVATAVEVDAVEDDAGGAEGTFVVEGLYVGELTAVEATDADDEEG